MKNIQFVRTIALGVLVWGCSDAPRTASPTNDASLETIVLPELLDRVGVDGRFIYPELVTQATIPRQRALELANAWKISIAPFLLPALEAERGGPINLAELTLDSRVHFAHAPYSVVEDAPKPLRKAFSGYYVVQFVDPRLRPVVSLAVSGQADDVSIENGRVRFPRHYGNEFVAVGIRTAAYGLPMSPENAARLAHALTAARLTELPMLLQEGRTNVGVRGPPQRGFWHVQLDREIIAIEAKSQMRRVTRDLYVSQQGRVFLAKLIQPASMRAAYTLPGDTSARTGLARLQLSEPVEFVQANVRGLR